MHHQRVLTLRRGLRSRLLQWFYETTSPYYARWLRRQCPAWQINEQELLQLPAGSLGLYIGEFLRAHDLNLLPQFENHDVFHVLLDYGVSAPEEVALQWCLVGNGKRSLYALATAFAGAIILPEYWGTFRKAYRRGKGLRRFYHWYFEYLLREDVEELRCFLARHK